MRLAALIAPHFSPNTLGLTPYIVLGSLLFISSIIIMNIRILKNVSLKFNVIKDCY